MDYDKRQSPDIDVMVLVHYMPQMRVVLEFGWRLEGTNTIDQRRMIPIHDIANAIRSTVCGVLPEVHTPTGCDTVSSFLASQARIK